MKVLAALFISLITINAGADSTVCRGTKLFFESHTYSGGARPYKGKLLSTMTLKYGGKLLETHEEKYQATENDPIHAIVFIESTRVVKSKSGNGRVGTEAYGILVEVARNDGRPLTRTIDVLKARVNCKSAWNRIRP
jgi:hypothetical protein